MHNALATLASERALWGSQGGGGGTGKKPQPQSPTENLLADYISSVE